MNFKPDGQILPCSAFGQKLTELAKDANAIVEIGTWNGGGSTYCLALGLVRPEQRLVTVESDPERHREARGRYGDSRITFLWGSVSQSDQVPMVLDLIPQAIDLLLIDGGDATGASDLTALWERSKIIALDDTNEPKNRSNRHFLKRAGWETVAENLTDRLGWSIFRRPP